MVSSHSLAGWPQRYLTVTSCSRAIRFAPCARSYSPSGFGTSRSVHSPRECTLRLIGRSPVSDWAWVDIEVVYL
jgi:hypothetical protein